ncbi:MAG: rRNA pseudouridine synthase [Lachnospiraceae bacterium]|nr:rRNA pseudouridine synthase [Lachnospiraceae bacterium]
MRLDKFLSEAGIGTRSELKKIIAKGLISVNGTIIKQPAFKVLEDKDQICYQNEPVIYKKYIYYMLNKPAGVLSATSDSKDPTVLDLIADSKRDLFPVGRLDKDTEGLLIITDDGALAHNLLSPKKHVPKVYYVKVDHALLDELPEVFAKGLKINDEFTALPATLKILPSADEALITITEGKFHQVKRMFQKVGYKVVYLKRMQMGALTLDETLAPGEYRELSREELILLSESENV